MFPLSRGGRSRYNVPLAVLLLILMVSFCAARVTIGNSLTFRSGGAGTGSAHPGVQGPLMLFLSTIKEARRHLAAAALARSVSIFAMYPVDTIKTRIQMDQSNALRLSGLYKGVSGSLLGQVPYG